MGLLQTVKKLLVRGVDPDAKSLGENYGNALQAASYGGYEEIVQMLLDRGADVNAQGGKFGSALQAPTCGGHEKIAQMLLEKHAV